MNVLRFVFPAVRFAMPDSFSIITEVCVHKYFNRVCFDHKNVDGEGPPPDQEPSMKPEKPWFRLGIYHYECFVLIVNLIFWILYCRQRKSYTGREGPFFTILFILSLTVSFRILFSIVAISISAFIRDPESSTRLFLLQSSLYMDYCSNFFSLSITFFMSLNRCFSFVARQWNSKLFEGLNVVLPIIFSGLIAIGAAVTCIITSEIKRNFIDRLGFVDVGPNKGFRVMINRAFFLFPIGSIICYLVLYYHLRQRSRLVLTRTNQSKGEQKVFVQLLVTTVLYVTLHLTYEILTLVDWTSDVTFQLTFISILGIFNCLPEMSLPFLLICSSLHIKNKVLKIVSTKTGRDTSARTVTAKPSMTAVNTDN